MAHEPTAAEVRAFAERYLLTDHQARGLLVEHGPDESRLAEAIESLKHFLKAPS